MSSETRKITVTGGSSVFRVDGGDQTSKTRRRKTTTVTSPQAIVKIDGGAPNTTQSVSSAIKSITVQPSLQESPTTVPAPQTNSRVILGGKKPKHMKVVLTKKNHETPAAPIISKPNRKVSLGLTHLKRRVTRARKLNKLSKTAPIEQIKKELIAAHIIKDDSKAPEHILRQMYADAKLLTSKSL